MLFRRGAFRVATTAVVVCWAVLIGSRSLRATEYFFDDFENYLDDTELQEIGGWQILEVNTPLENAAWTILNPGGRGHPAMANGFPSDGQFIISDSDHAGSDGDLPGTGMSHDIWSPPFSCNGATKVWLHMDCVAQLNNNGLVIFDVDVSTDGGTVWTNVFRRVAPGRAAEPVVSLTNTDGFLGRLDLDITALAANKPSVQFRLRQFEPNDDWWIAADNVLVDDQAVVNGAVNLVFERFSSGIPNTWTIRSLADPQNTGDMTWNSNDPCKHSALRFNGGKVPYQDGRGIHRLDAGYAILDSGCNTGIPTDEYLITPTIDCTNATQVYLQYKSEIVVSSGAAQDVLLSLDGGVTFETELIFSYNAGAGFASTEDTFYAERTFFIPQAAGKSQVAFAFHHQGPGVEDNYWAVDDVKVSANGNGLNGRTCANREFDVQPFNPATSSVTMSWKGIVGDDGFRILANGAQIGADLPSSARGFTDAAPPAGGSVSYSLQVLVVGAVESECSASAISVISCPRDFACCVNQSTKVVSLSWVNGVNLAGTGYRILRNGVPRATVPLNATTFLDNTLPGPGSYDYQLVLNGGNVAQCPDLPLKCRANVLGEDLLFYDDFDCYVSDATLTGAGWEIHEENTPVENCLWTTVDLGGRGNPPDVDGSATTGKFIVSDSDAAGGADGQGTGRSHDIWTPVINCTGKNTVWLHAACTIVLNNNGLVVFDADVSADNGATWENVFRRVAPARSVDPIPVADIPDGFENGPQTGNADGFFGSLDVDISAIAKNQPNVRIRFRQFEPDDDWWMAIDNVLVDTKPLPHGSKILLGPETFDDGIPSEWPIDSEPGTSPWIGGDPCLVSLLGTSGGLFPDSFDGHGLHHLDDHFAIVGPDELCSTPASNETLVTPTLDCTTMTAVYLHFKSDLLVTDAVAEVLLSLDGGATFDTAAPLFTYHGTGGLYRNADNAEVIYNEHTLSVPKAVGQKRVAFAFHYLNAANRVAFWAIDDVEVSAEGGGVAEPQFHRGDADDNGKLELTDAIRILNYLFTGGVAPACFDAADADDNGKLELTDAIRILNYLFTGGVAPAPPGPPPQACGPDVNKEAQDLGCVTYTKC